MNIPEELLQKLTCSVCFKYLSVGPIKVYPNRRVKCGRCAQENDGGAVSLLYETIAKNLLFPCINRFDGCRDVLNIADTKDHETICEEVEYDCPLCNNFGGTSYDLNLHIQCNHEEDTLQATEFIINLQKGNQEKQFFCHKNGLLFFIRFRYDATEQQLFLSITFVGKKYKGDVMQQFVLQSVDNFVQHQTYFKSCLKLGDTFDTHDFFFIDLSSMKFEENIVVCRFNINEEPVLTLQPKMPLWEPEAESAILRFRFYNTRKLRNFGQLVYPGYFFVKKIPWTLIIGGLHLGRLIVLLKQNDLHRECFVVGSALILARTSTRLSSTFKGNITEKGGWFCNLGFDVKLEELVNLESSFLEDSPILIEVKLQVENLHDEYKCIYCESCKKCKNHLCEIYRL